jgi:hypothetical protein
MEALPNELLVAIFARVRLRDLASLRVCSRRLGHCVREASRAVTGELPPCLQRIAIPRLLGRVFLDPEGGSEGASVFLASEGGWFLGALATEAYGLYAPLSCALSGVPKSPLSLGGFVVAMSPFALSDWLLAASGRARPSLVAAVLEIATFGGQGCPVVAAVWSGGAAAWEAAAHEVVAWREAVRDPDERGSDTLQALVALASLFVEITAASSPLDPIVHLKGGGVSRSMARSLRERAPCLLARALSAGLAGPPRPTGWVLAGGEGGGWRNWRHLARDWVALRAGGGAGGAGWGGARGGLLPARAARAMRGAEVRRDQPPREGMGGGRRLLAGGACRPNIVAQRSLTCTRPERTSSMAMSAASDVFVDASTTASSAVRPSDGLALSRWLFTRRTPASMSQLPRMLRSANSRDAPYDCVASASTSGVPL